MGRVNLCAVSHDHLGFFWSLCDFCNWFRDDSDDAQCRLELHCNMISKRLRKKCMLSPAPPDSRVGVGVGGMLRRMWGEGGWGLFDTVWCCGMWSVYVYYHVLNRWLKGIGHKPKRLDQARTCPERHNKCRPCLSGSGIGRFFSYLLSLSTFCHVSVTFTVAHLSGCFLDC